ncbi:MAG: hypothetical protein ACP5NV_04780 [Candidatus Woesearchaeota archaeon]
MKITILLAILVTVLFVSACTTSPAPVENNGVEVIPQEEPETPESTLPEVLQSPLEKATQAAYNDGYKGTVLAGKNAYYMEFNQRDYDFAVEKDKLIVLTYYTAGDETSEKEDSEAQAAFYELESPDVIGFRVHYEDDKVGVDEKKIIAKFGVANKNTKVIVRGGERVFKEVDVWDKNTYLDEITRNI